jgi:hypothetical protein
LLDVLAEAGVRHIFGIPGDAINTLGDLREIIYQQIPSPPLGERARERGVKGGRQPFFHPLPDPLPRAGEGDNLFEKSPKYHVTGNFARPEPETFSLSPIQNW